MIILRILSLAHVSGNVRKRKQEVSCAIEFAFSLVRIETILWSSANFSTAVDSSTARDAYQKSIQFLTDLNTVAEWQNN